VSENQRALTTFAPPRRTAGFAAFSSCLDGLDREGALAMIADAGQDGMGLEAIITGILAPALVEVGRRWATGEVGAAEALAASAIARSCIPRSSVRSSRPDEDRRTVSVCCPPGEDHVIPAEMVTEVLRHHGWPVQHLGAGITVAQLPAFLDRYQPLAVLVSCTTPAGLVGAAQLIEVAHRHHVPVLVGGAAFGDDDLLALRLGAAGWASSAANAVGLLEEWLASPPALAPHHDPPSDFAGLGSAGLAIRAGAAAAARRIHGLGDDPMATDERLDLLLRYLEAALLVDDGRVFLDFLAWRAGYDRCRQIGDERLDATLQAVEAALPLGCDRGRRFVQDGRQHLLWARRAVRTRRSGPVPRPAIAATAHRPLAHPGQAGRVFSDLLLVAANGCDVPLALLSVAQPDGGWSTLSHPSRRGGSAGRPDKGGEERLFALAAQQDGPLQIPNLAERPDFATTDMVACAGGVRFAYALALRNHQGLLLGVLSLLDRRSRTLSVAEHQVIAAIARHVTGQLVQWVGNVAAPPEPHDQRRRPPRATGEKLLHSHDVAMLFDVTDRTVINWAATNKIPSVRTAGGHLRFRGDDVLALREGQTFS
jgi:methanogenic corrinoid protein MtbC1